MAGFTGAIQRDIWGNAHSSDGESLKVQPMASRAIRLLHFPYLCPECDIHQQVCKRCHRPLESPIYHGDQAEEQGTAPNTVKQFSSDKDVATVNKELEEWKSRLQRCIACEFSVHGTVKQPGPERYTSCAREDCTLYQNQRRLSQQQRDRCEENGWSRLCHKCEEFCRSTTFQELLRGSDDTTWLILPMHLEEFGAMFHGECQFCRAIANIVDEDFPRVGDFAIKMVLTSGEEGFGIHLHREQGHIKVSTMKSHLKTGGILKYLANLLICAEPDVAAAIGTSSKINLDVKSEAAFQQAHSWLKDCLETHQDCFSHEDGPMPTRLIDVTSTPPKLIQSGGRRVGYAALSYCWGGKQELELRESRVAQYTQGLPRDLPLSLSDAIEATKRLKIGFLWVDSLCIIQDDPVDKENELSCMGNIYANAIITIVAASAWSVHEGFLGLRTAPMNAVTIPLLAENEPDSRVTVIPQQPETDVVYCRENPVERRAWTFQEKILSPRKLVYSTTNLRWECNSTIALDGGDERMLGSHAVACTRWPIKDENRHKDAWHEIVSEFSKRLLSVEEDKLPAIAAVAERHAAENNDIYLAGLWQSQLAFDLVWVIESNSLTARRPRHFRGPTWSWVAVEEPVGWDPPPAFTFQRRVQDDDFKVVEWTPVLRSSKLPYGGLLPGSILTLQGRVAELGTREQVIKSARQPEYLQELKKMVDDDNAAKELQGQKTDPIHSIPHQLNYHNCIRFDDEESDVVRYLEDGQVYALLTGHTLQTEHHYIPSSPFGLLLSCHGNIADGTFKRIGVFWNHGLPSITEQIFSEVEPRALVLL